MTAPDPTAGEHRRVGNGPDALDTCTGCDWESWDTAPSFADHPASPPAVAASTGTSEDVETLADDEWNGHGELAGRLNWDRKVFTEEDVLSIVAAREAAARAEERERIAQAIEADGPPADYPGGTVAGRAYARAARIAREVRP